MNNSRQAQVLYRYDKESDRQSFKSNFDCHFHIRAFNNDEELNEALRQAADEPTTLILDREIFDNTLPEQCKLISPGLLTIQLNHHFSLEDIVMLLEGGNIDRCFAKPYDRNLLKSEIYTHMLTPASAIQNPAAPSAPAERESQENRQKYTAMIVDDETVATRFLSKQLRQLNCPCELLIADSAEQALELYSKCNTEIALVISDQRMPGKQGHQLLNEIRRRNPDTIRMLTSAYDEVDVALNAVNEGNIRRYIKKPWQAGHIKTLISEAVQSYRHAKANTQDQQFSIEQAYHNILTDRQVKLEKALAGPVETCLCDTESAHCLKLFFACLNTIKTLPASAASLRASRETSLEDDLVKDFIATVKQKTAHLTSLLSKSSGNTNSLALALSELVGNNNKLPVHDDECPEQALAQFIVQCLQQVIQASGMQLSHCQLQHNNDHLRLDVLNQQCLPILKHLLSAHTRVSPQMLEQQSGLLMLFIISKCTQLSLDCKASARGLCLTLQLPLGSSSSPTGY